MTDIPSAAEPKSTHLQRVIAIGVLCFALMLSAGLFLYTVEPGETVRITHWNGEVTQPETPPEPGLYVRLPYPFMSVEKQLVSPFFTYCEPENGPESLLCDRTPIRVALRVHAAQAPKDADRFPAVLAQCKNEVLATLTPDSFFAQETEALFTDAVATKLREKTDSPVQGEITVYAIRLDNAVLDAIEKRMLSDAEAVSALQKAQFERARLEQTAKADLEIARIESESRLKIEQIRQSQWELHQAAVKAFEADPEAALFIRQMMMIEQLLNAQSTLFIDGSTPLFDILNFKPDSVHVQ